MNIVEAQAAAWAFLFVNATGRFRKEQAQPSKRQDWCIFESVARVWHRQGVQPPKRVDRPSGKGEPLLKTSNALMRSVKVGFEPFCHFIAEKFVYLLYSIKTDSIIEVNYYESSSKHECRQTGPQALSGH